MHQEFSRNAPLVVRPIQFKMEININNKIFLGKFDENGKLIIPLTDKDDVLYFQQWISQKRILC